MLRLTNKVNYEIILYMIVDSYYLSEPGMLKKTTEITELCEDEIFYMVGKFTKRSHRQGKYRGEVVVKSTGEVVIRHHFTKKVIWVGYLNEL